MKEPDPLYWGTKTTNERPTYTSMGDATVEQIVKAFAEQDKAEKEKKKAEQKKKRAKQEERRARNKKKAENYRLSSEKRLRNDKGQFLKQERNNQKAVGYEDDYEDDYVERERREETGESSSAYVPNPEMNDNASVHDPEEEVMGIMQTPRGNVNGNMQIEGEDLTDYVGNAEGHVNRILYNLGGNGDEIVENPEANANGALQPAAEHVNGNLDISEANGNGLVYNTERNGNSLVENQREGVIGVMPNPEVVMEQPLENQNGVQGRLQEVPAGRVPHPGLARRDSRPVLARRGPLPGSARRRPRPVAARREPGPVPAGPGPLPVPAGRETRPVPAGPEPLPVPAENESPATPTELTESERMDESIASVVAQARKPASTQQPTPQPESPYQNVTQAQKPMQWAPKNAVHEDDSKTAHEHCTELLNIRKPSRPAVYRERQKRSKPAISLNRTTGNQGNSMTDVVKVVAVKGSHVNQTRKGISTFPLSTAAVPVMTIDVSSDNECPSLASKAPSLTPPRASNDVSLPISPASESGKNPVAVPEVEKKEADLFSIEQILLKNSLPKLDEMKSEIVATEVTPTGCLAETIQQTAVSAPLPINNVMIQSGNIMTSPLANLENMNCRLAGSEHLGSQEPNTLNAMANVRNLAPAFVGIPNFSQLLQNYQKQNSFGVVNTPAQHLQPQQEVFGIANTPVQHPQLQQHSSIIGNLPVQQPEQHNSAVPVNPVSASAPVLMPFPLHLLACLDSARGVPGSLPNNVAHSYSTVHVEQPKPKRKYTKRPPNDKIERKAKKPRIEMKIQQDIPMRVPPPERYRPENIPHAISSMQQAAPFQWSPQPPPQAFLPQQSPASLRSTIMSLIFQDGGDPRQLAAIMQPLLQFYTMKYIFPLNVARSIEAELHYIQNLDSQQIAALRNVYLAKEELDRLLPQQQM